MRPNASTEATAGKSAKRGGVELGRAEEEALQQHDVAVGPEAERVIPKPQAGYPSSDGQEEAVMPNPEPHSDP